VGRYALMGRHATVAEYNEKLDAAHRSV